MLDRSGDLAVTALNLSIVSGGERPDFFVPDAKLRQSLFNCLGYLCSVQAASITWSISISAAGRADFTA